MKKPFQEEYKFGEIIMNSSLTGGINQVISLAEGENLSLFRQWRQNSLGLKLISKLPPSPNSGLILFL